MNLPVKPYIKNKLKTSYAVEGPETQYTIDCGDGVNVHTVSEKARQALQHLDHSLAQMGAALQLGEFGCRMPVLENVVYLGLPLVQRAVFDGSWAQIKKQKIWRSDR